MLSQVITKILFLIFTVAIARGVVTYFGLDIWVAHMIGRLITAGAEYQIAIAWILSGLIGLIVLLIWVAFGGDQKIQDLFAPRPALGSLPQVNAIMKVNRDQKNNRTDVEMVVDLQNYNNDLLGFHCELRATVNGKDLDSPVIFDGYINANHRTSLILNMNDVPTPVTDNFASMVGRMKYNVIYYFTNNKTKTRRTSKLVEWRTRFQVSGVKVGTRIEEPVHVRFYDEIEE